MKKRILIICTIVSVVLVGVFFFLSGRYHVRNVVVAGNKHYTEEEIKQMVLDGGIYDNSLLLSLKYKNKEIADIPFVESMDVEITAPDSIKINVYEKALAGCVEYLGKYMYFDREGTVVECSDEPSPDIPQVTGLKYGYMVLYEKLPVENQDVFQQILVLNQLLGKYGILPEKIHFDRSMSVTLFFGKAKVALGSQESINEKIMHLQNVLPKMSGKEGTLRMENYAEGTEKVTFEPD